MRGMFAVALAAAMLFAGCSANGTGSPGGDCTSHYEPVADADTLEELKQTLRDDFNPRVRTLLVVDDHPEEGKKYVNLLDGNRRLVASLDFWQGDDGTWTVQRWSQCID